MGYAYLVLKVEGSVARERVLIAEGASRAALGIVPVMGTKGSRSFVAAAIVLHGTLRVAPDADRGLCLSR